MGGDGTRVASPIPADSSLGGSVQTRRVCPLFTLGRVREEAAGRAGRQRTAGRSRQVSGQRGRRGPDLEAARARSGRTGAGAVRRVPAEPREAAELLAASAPVPSMRMRGSPRSLPPGISLPPLSPASRSLPGAHAPSPPPSFPVRPSAARGLPRTDASIPPTGPHGDAAATSFYLQRKLRETCISIYFLLTLISPGTPLLPVNREPGQTCRAWG